MMWQLHRRSLGRRRPRRPSSPERYERTLCFRTDPDNSNTNYFYAVNISNRGAGDDNNNHDNAGDERRRRRRPSKISPISTKTSNFADTLVCLDSTLYSLGGFRCQGERLPEEDRTMNDVLCFDSSSSIASRRWNNLVSSPMNVGRSNPAAVVVNRKIYVFGGNNDTDPDRWAEVFDPDTNKWSFLPKRPCDDLCQSLFNWVGSRYLFNWVDSQKIVVFADRFEDEYVCVYDVCENNWTKHPIKIYGGLHFAYWTPNEDMVVVGGTLYLYNRNGDVSAYELETGWFFHGRLRGFEVAADKISDDRSQIKTNLFHLAGRLFCLVWAEGNIVNCTEFIMEKSYKSQAKGKRKRKRKRKRRRNCGTLRACVVSSRAYDLGRETGRVDVVLMNEGCGLVSTGIDATSVDGVELSSAN